MWWLWKHRKAWRQIKELWERRVELLRFIGDVNILCGLQVRPSTDSLTQLGLRADDYVKWIRRTGIVGKPLNGIPLARPWPDPPPSQRSKRLMMRGIELPAPLENETNPWLTDDGRLKPGVAPPLPKRG